MTRLAAREDDLPSRSPARLRPILQPKGHTEKRFSIARPLFLRWALVNALAAVAFVAAAVAYAGQVHSVGKLAAGVVLVVFAAASANCGVLAWRADSQHARGVDARGLEHVAFAIRVCPMIAMLGTASGFLIAFAGSTDDVQQRVAGASTGIVATVVGVACTIVLMLERHLLDER